MFIGIDVGSRAVKGVLLGEDGQRVTAVMQDQGVEQERIAEQVCADLLSEARVSQADVRTVVATGYGRRNVACADRVLTEISCHAQGAWQALGEVDLVIDVGGQDSKVIHLDEHGAVADFVMNDRCAAGTGRFLEVVAGRLNVSLEELSQQALASEDPCPINSTCVVFAETEIVGLLARGAAPVDVAAGILQAMCRRIASMTGGTGDKVVGFTGGVARLPAAGTWLERELGCSVCVPDEPQYVGALGAALQGMVQG